MAAGKAAVQAARRRAELNRTTKETQITVRLNLDGQGRYAIKTGIGFLDHMLEQLARHSGMDIALEAKGDLHIDQHHTAEDCGLALGAALREALGDKRGIARFASVTIPMDEALTRAALDISGRPHLVWRVKLTRAKLGDMDAELFREWFGAFVQSAGLTLHMENLYGANNHHIVESCYKALAQALRQAAAKDARRANQVPSTKEFLDKS